MTGKRNDDDWTRDLASADTALLDDAVGDLRDMLCRGLSKSLSKTGQVDDSFLDDVVQEACMKILEKLGTFKGRSKFRTWAVTIAVRTAVSKMRKRDWENVSLESVTAGSGFDPQIAIDTSETVDQVNSRKKLLSKLGELINRELTERQWTAVTAELGGMPLPQSRKSSVLTRIRFTNCCMMPGRNCGTALKLPVLQAMTFARHGGKLALWLYAPNKSLCY